MTKKLLLALSVAALCGGCNLQPAPEVQARIARESEAAAVAAGMWDDVIIPPGTFQGVKVPGNAIDARAGGFTECAPGMDSRRDEALICKRRDPRVLGVSATSAHVVLVPPKREMPDGTIVPVTALAQTKLEDLSYNDVEFWFTGKGFDPKCATAFAEAKPGAPKSPMDCYTDGSVPDLVKALESGGWVNVNNGDWLKDGDSVELSLSSDAGLMSLPKLVARSIHPAEVADRLTAAREHQATADREKAATSALVDQMKSAQ